VDKTEKDKTKIYWEDYIGTSLPEMGGGIAMLVYNLKIKFTGDADKNSHVEDSQPYKGWCMFKFQGTDVTILKTGSDVPDKWEKAGDNSNWVNQLPAPPMN
jgi:hypothetical protein